MQIWSIQKDGKTVSGFSAYIILAKIDGKEFLMSDFTSAYSNTQESPIVKLFEALGVVFVPNNIAYFDDMKIMFDKYDAEKLLEKLIASSQEAQFAIATVDYNFCPGGNNAIFK